jgi:alpha-N-arabinofuranosidase
MAADASGNIIANYSFEDAPAGVPTGWTRDQQSAAKGEATVVREHATQGGQALRLSPNEKNVDSEKLSTPLALGQGFDARTVAGKALYVSGDLLASGGATAVLAVYVHRTDGAILGVRLTQDASRQSMTAQRGQLVVPDDGKNKFVVLICAAEGQKGAVHFDNIRMATSLPAPAARDAREGRGAALEAEIAIDAARVLRSIPRTLYGTNLEWIWDGNGLVNASGDLSTEAVRLSRELGVSLLRFPGGVFSDFYDWKNGVGALSTRPETFYMPGAGRSSHRFGTDEALRLSRDLGAPLLITANIVTGKPEDAVAWMRYIAQRVEQDPRIPPVRIWELGNENYNDGPLPYLAKATLAPAAYAKRFMEFARALRTADPGVRLAAISDANFGTLAQPSYPRWDDTVLPIVGREIDYLAVHNAYSPTLAVDRGEDLRAVYAAMLASPVLVRRNIADVASRIKAAVPDRADKIKIAITEWGPAFQITPQGRYVDHVKTLGSALYVASVMKVFVESPAVEVANFFKLTDPLWSGWIGKRGNAFVATAPYLAFQFYSRHFGDQLVQSQTHSPTFSTRAVGRVDGVSDVPYLDVVASLGGGGKSVHVIGINKHFDRDIRARVRISGFIPRGEGRAWTLGGTGIDAHAGSDVFRAPGVKWARQASDIENPRFDKGGPGEITVTESSTGTVASDFEYVFPARSVTVIVLPGAR